MSKSLAEDLLKYILKDAPFLASRVDVARLGNGEWIVRIRTGPDLRFHVWDFDNWQAVKGQFGVRAEVEVEA